MSREFSDQERYGGQIDASIAFEGSVLTSLDFGAKYSDSSRRHTYQSYTRSTNLFDANGREFSWSQLGLFDGSVDAVVPGLYEWNQPLTNSGRL